MGLRIEPTNGVELALFGDVEAVVSLPARSRDGRFSLAFSDGTLVIGEHRGAFKACVFEVATAGASRVKIDRSSGTEALLFDGKIEWILLGSDTDTLRSDGEPSATREPRFEFDDAAYFTLD